MTTAVTELPVHAGWVTISRAAELLGISRQAVHKMTRTSPPRLYAERLESAGEDRPLVVRKKDVLAMKTAASEVIPVPLGQEK